MCRAPETAGAVVGPRAYSSLFNSSIPLPQDPGVRTGIPAVLHYGDAPRFHPSSIHFLPIIDSPACAGTFMLMSNRPSEPFSQSHHTRCSLSCLPTISKSCCSSTSTCRLSAPPSPVPCLHAYYLVRRVHPGLLPCPSTGNLDGTEYGKHPLPSTPHRLAQPCRAWRWRLSASYGNSAWPVTCTTLRRMPES